MKSGSSIRVVLVDDHPMLRAGVRALLEAESDIACVGEASDGAEALRLVRATDPDIILLDMSLPVLSGIAVAQHLHDVRSRCGIVALTAHDEVAWMEQILGLGLKGYVLKRSAPSDLPRAVRLVAAGGTWFDPSVAGNMIAIAGRGEAQRASENDGLTNRELRVLRMSALGHPNKTIANDMNIGVRTVETHKNNAMEKLGLYDRVGLVAYAQRRGWFSAGEFPGTSAEVRTIAGS